MGGSLLDVLTNALASVLHAASLLLVVIGYGAQRRAVLLGVMGMVSGDNRVGDEVYRCLLPILWHDNHTQIFS